MVSLGRILRDYKEAGAVNTMISLWGFVDDEAFLTKRGDVGVVFRLRGPDAEGLTHAERQQVVHQFEAGLKLLDEHCRLYQYVIKSSAAPFVAPACRRTVADQALKRRSEYLNAQRQKLFAVEHFLVLVYEPPASAIAAGRSVERFLRSPRSELRARLSTARTCALLEAELNSAIAALHRHARALEVQLPECGLERLGKTEAFSFLRRLVNYDPAVAEAATLSYDTHLDYFVADSPIECHRDRLTVGNQIVKVLSMKEPPAQTFANMLSDLLAVPGQFIACLEWQRCDSDGVRRDIQSRRRHFFNKRVSLVNYVASETRPEEMLVDDSAGATVRQLGEALSETEVNGHFFGSCSLTLVFYGEELRSLQASAAEAMKVLATHDGSAFEESYNLLNAWLSIVPGNSAYNVRKIAVLETNLADLSFLFTQDSGEQGSSRPGRPEALAVFETTSQTPYFYNLHVQDVGHTLILGATGSGKSFLLNFLITHLQQYDPITVVLDLGHSYRKLSSLLGGRYVELGLRQDGVTMNPYDLASASPEQLHFLHSFTRVLLEGEGGRPLTELEDRETYEAVENLFVLDRSQRRLFTLANLLPRALGNRLHKWIEGGRYAAMFDNPHDTLTMERLQLFDFESMREYPSLLEPLLFYVLHRVNDRIREASESGALKICVMDEAWRLIQHPTLRAYVQEALKTWRKCNAAVLLTTQSIEDFASVDLLRTVVESCPTRLLLANPSFDRRQYGELFQMNDMQLDLLASLVPRRQVLLKRTSLAKVLTLSVDPKSYWIYTNTPVDDARLSAVCREFGFTAGIDKLAASA